MEAARLRRRGRRLRRGSVERPLNGRLVRVGFVAVVPAFLALLFSVTTTGALPRSPLDPLFDAESAAAYAETFATLYPSRVPGSEGAVEAARWYRETVSSVGLSAEEDTWTEDLADLGTVELTNVVTVVPGQSEETIVVVAHRDNAGAEEPLGENASGTATLIELGRGFAPQEVGPDPLPQHTLVLVSTDAGAFGGAGAARFAATSPFAERAVAAVILDDLGRGRPRLAIAGDTPASPARTLVRTASIRIAEEVGVMPSLPSIPAQLVDLGVPFALNEQGRFLAHGLSSVTLTTERAIVPPSTGDPAPDVSRLGQLGRGTEALVSSLDASAGGVFRTPDSVFFADRAASGWIARLALVLSIVPFSLGVVDLAVRGRRRGLPFAAALRSQRARLGVWMYAGLLAWVGALAGVLPSGAPLPLPPYTDFVDNPPLFGIFVLAVTFVFGWLWTRPRLRATAVVTPEERLAGFVVGLGLLALVAAGLAVTQPYAIVFVLPSLYAWLWLPLDARAGVRIGVYLVGLAGPVVGLVLLGRQVDLSPVDAALYVVGLVTVGYLPLVSALLGLAWIAAAAQLAALASGRYSQYAGGAEPPPPGPLRRLLLRRR